MRLKYHLWISIVSALLCLSTLGEGFKDESPRYNYDTLPKTSFTCQGKLAGRYYADAETDCQLFHVCVKMNVRDTQDFKFLCPNGTTFDQEHQVCMDFLNVVCHENIGTNPLGQFFELMKLSSGLKNPGLDSKYSFVDPDVAERNTLGDDFQVDEYNNNRLASSQNSLYQSSKSNRKSASDIFYKPQKPTKYTTTSTTPRPTPSTTAAPLVFRSPIPSNEPRTSSVSPRRPSLETFESYETESVAGFTGQNSFNQGGNQNSKDFLDSYEVRDQVPSTTRRPAVFHNTFRTSFPEQPSTAIPAVQTYQQQASRFNDDFFRKLPASTETSVSKAAQFYVNSNSGQYSTPEVRQPTTNPFHRTTSTTPIPPRRSHPSSTTRPYQTSNTDTGFQYEIQSTTEEPYRRTPTTTEYTTKPFFSAKINDRGLSNRGSSNRGTSQQVPSSTTSVPSILVENARHSKFFVPPQSNSEESDRPKSFSAKIVNNFPVENTIRPRSFSGTSNVNYVNRQSNRDNFGFSTILPPTTAEPITRPTTTLGPFYQSETEATQQKGNAYFQRLTTLKPEKFSIFFSKSTTYANKEYTNTEKETKYPSSGRSTVVYYEPTSTYRPPTTNKIPVEYEQQTAASGSRIQNFGNSYASSTQFPESTTALPTSTTSKPSRRGARRRINRPRPLVPRNFDPEYKYSRQIEGTEEKSQKEAFSSKNEEIFTAQASVFPGRPKANSFQEQRKEVTQANGEEEQVRKTKGPAEDSPKIVENYGRRIRPGRREQIHQRKTTTETQDIPATSEKPREHQPRRLIKRLKVKASTPAPEATFSPSSTTSVYIPSTTILSTSSYKPTPSTFSPYGSTLRPVKRINVKTKIGQRKFDQEPQIQTSQSRNPFFTLFEKHPRKLVSTTEEPELVTASAEDIARRKQSKLTTVSVTKDLTTPTTYRPTIFNEKKNSTSSVIIKVTTKSQQSPFPTPISFKQPILTTFGKKDSKLYTKVSIQEGPTRSPDYDYSYYNSDDDYNDQTSKLEHKNYGKKPNNKKALPQEV